jgi:hypothetical protein
MNKNDKPRFTQIMLGMADNFRDTITSEGMAMRFDMLREYSIEQVEASARQIMRHRKYTKMPPVAEFVEAIEGKQEIQSRNTWGIVMRCLEQGSPPLDLKISETIRRIGGWDWLAQQTFDQLQWAEKRFYEHFDSVSETPIPALPGGNMAELADKVGLRMLEGGKACQA